MDTCGQGIPRSVSAVSAESYGVLSANSFSLAPHSGSRARGSAGASSGGASIRRLESILQSELESLRQSCPQEKSSILSVSSYISSQDSLAEAPTPIRLDVASASEKPENVGLSSDVPSKGNMSLVPDRNSFRSGDVANLCSKQMMALLVEHPAFVCFFMTLTTYALFASDLNQKYGSKDTEQSVHIVNTVVFFLFLIELLLHSIVTQSYICRAYFWLDLVALLSLVPDTLILQLLLQSHFSQENSLMAGRSARLTRPLKVLRSIRMNRLARVARVASVIPKMLRILGRRVKQEEINQLMNMKLRRMFMCLDDDMDCHITRDALEECLGLIRQRGSRSRALGKKMMMTKTFTAFRHYVPNFKSDTHRAASTTDSRPTTRCSEASIYRLSQSSDGLVNFNTFKSEVLGDAWVKAQLEKRCREQLVQSNSMQNVTSRHSEDVGVKVSLGVLGMLLLLSFINQRVEDKSLISGLKLLQQDVAQIHPPHPQTPIPNITKDYVHRWMQGYVKKCEAELLYLDVSQWVYCNVLDGKACATNSDSAVFWSARQHDGIARLARVLAKERRPLDLKMICLADNKKVCDDTPPDQISALAYLDVRACMEDQAMFSLLTTVVIIVIIVGGVLLLTRDLTNLSGVLLTPLRDLADEMNSIAQLQLAGLNLFDQSSTEKTATEIRRIQRIFKTMKNAIKNWGKYVPWPVVQLLLKAGVDATTGVKEKEVTIFFSDIASFTSIVESIEPEKSVSLLSRYFEDMSHVIDDHGGIVLEFIGDAILSVFGAPVKNESHPTAAVKATLRMLSVLGQLNEWSKRHGLPVLSVRCGIHTGTVLLGNMGFHSRMKYGVVGEDEKIPEHLEELNKVYGTSMLVSETTFSRLEPDQFVARPIDCVQLRQTSVAPAELVYEVLCRKRARKAGELSRVATLYTHGLDAYLARSFHEAEFHFHKVDRKMCELGFGHDQPSALMISRCRSFSDNPPPDNWTGIWDQGR